MKLLKIKTILFFAFCSLFFALLQWSPSFADPDSFYHAKMAALMGQEGVINTFPWLKFASFSQNFTDQHFFYHLLLIPFISVFPSFLGVKILTVLLAMSVIVFFYFFLQRWGIRWPIFYILVLLSIPPFVFRINLAKAGPLAIIILFIGLSLIWQKRYRALFLLSFLYVWTHGGWILLLILTVCQIISEIITNKEHLFCKGNRRLLLAVFGGIITGLIINPSFPHNLQFYWEQLVQIGAVNYQNILEVGGEWHPLKISDSVSINTSFLILTFAVWTAFFWRIKDETGETDERFNKLLTLYIFSVLLAVMTIKSQRYIEYFVPFFVLTNAFLLNFFLLRDFSPSQSLKIFFQSSLSHKTIVIFITSGWLILFLCSGWKLRQQLTGRISWSYLQNASQWLKEKTPFRSLVFHSDWSDFPMLFFHNDRNTYIAGLDPTFFYLFDSKLYQKWDKIIGGEEPDMAEIIKKDFGANFVLIKPTEIKLLEKVEKNSAFSLKYRDKEAQIFQIR